MQFLLDSLLSKILLMNGTLLVAIMMMTMISVLNLPWIGELEFNGYQVLLLGYIHKMEIHCGIIPLPDLKVLTI